MVDSLVTAEIALHNFGRRPVTIDSVSFEGDSSNFAFEVELPGRINPSDTLFVPMAFLPRDDTTYSATLTFWYADTSLHVNLSGQGVTTNSIENDMVIPCEFIVEPVYPNPFNSITSITYGLPQASFMKLKIFDLMGREVATLFEGEQRAGYHKVAWQGVNQNGLPVSSGMYFIRMESDQFVRTQKMTLVK